MNDEGKRPAGQKTPQPAADVEQVGILTRVSDGRQYSLGFGSLRVGRQRRADLVITDKTVSRHHADVCYEGGRYVLYDHSTNGTWINGTLVAVAQPLRNGDMVKFGKIEYRFNLKTVPADEAARAELQTSPKRIPKTSTVIMRGGKGKRRPLRSLLRIVLTVAAVLVVAWLAIYFLLPDLAASIRSQLPASLQGLLGGG